MKSNMFWQDNETAEKMAKNVKMACSSKSTHIRIKVFWVADKAKQGNLSVKHCSTNKILVYFFTNNLQGSKFKLFRRVIMGCDDVASLRENSDDRYKVSSTSKKLVEDTGYNVDVDDGHTDGHVGNVNHGYTDTHVYPRTWYDVVSRGTIG